MKRAIDQSRRFRSKRCEVSDDLEKGINSWALSRIVVRGVLFYQAYAKVGAMMLEPLTSFFRLISIRCDELWLV